MPRRMKLPFCVSENFFKKAIRAFKPPRGKKVKSAREPSRRNSSRTTENQVEMTTPYPTNSMIPVLMSLFLSQNSALGIESGDLDQGLRNFVLVDFDHFPSDLDGSMNSLD